MERSIQVTCQKRNLKKIREFVSEILNHLYFAPNDVSLLVLAVDEVCANVIIHSQECDSESSITVKVGAAGNGVCFEIYDRKGHSFNMCDYQAPAGIADIVHNKKHGGMGLMLVKRIMDDIQQETCGKNTIYKLFKRFSQRGAAQA